MTIHGIYENGVFKPLEHVNLAEHTRVLIVAEDRRSELPTVTPEAMDKIYKILGESFYDPNSPGNLAERHNEHQP